MTYDLPPPCGLPDRFGWSCCGYPQACRRLPSWREELAARLDDACAVDVSGSGINREPVSWWKTG